MVKKTIIFKKCLFWIQKMFWENNRFGLFGWAGLWGNRIFSAVNVRRKF